MLRHLLTVLRRQVNRPVITDADRSLLGAIAFWIRGRSTLITPSRTRSSLWCSNEVWPFWELEGRDAGDVLDRAEFTVYQQALRKSKFFAVLNEGEITETEMIDLPPSVRGAILPLEARESREHPDLRLARRARTIADLARVISERQVSLGIRRTLLGTVSAARTSGPHTIHGTGRHRR